MHPDIEILSDEKARSEADKYLRLFGVSYTALLMIADPRNSADKQNLAAEAVALIERYPHDDEFVCGGSNREKSPSE